jgi:hypothetical protein
MLSDTGTPIISNLLHKAVESWPAFFGLLIIPFVKYVFDRQINKKGK